MSRFRVRRDHRARQSQADRDRRAHRAGHRARPRLQADRHQFAKAASAHPQFAGKTATFSQNGFYGGKLYAYPAGLNTEFLSYLGFTINPRLAALSPRRGQQAEVSAERLDVLDADVLVFATEEKKDVAALMKVPTFKRLKGIATNHAVYTDATLSGAMYFISPLSLPYVLDRLPAQLDAALKGQAPRRIVATAKP